MIFHGIFRISGSVRIRKDEKMNALKRVITAAAMVLSLTAAVYAGKVTYTYDDAGRLTGAVYDNGKEIAYTYDNAGNLLSEEISPMTPGDVFPDDTLNLKDVITALQVISGLASETVSLGGDVNEDGKIGLAEAIYGLQQAGEQKDQ